MTVLLLCVYAVIAAAFLLCAVLGVRDFRGRYVEFNDAEKRRG